MEVLVPWKQVREPMKRTNGNLEKTNLFLFLPCIFFSIISVRKIFVLLDLTWKTSNVSFN